MSAACDGGTGLDPACSRASRRRPGSHCVKVTSGPSSSLPTPLWWPQSDKDSGGSDCPLSGRFRFTVLVTRTRQSRTRGWGGEGGGPCAVTVWVSIELTDRHRAGLGPSPWRCHGAQVPGRGLWRHGCHVSVELFQNHLRKELGTTRG